MMADERLEALVARHEAITHTVELLSHDVRDLYATAKQDGENIRALARIAEMHDRRLTAPEGGQ